MAEEFQESEVLFQENVAATATAAGKDEVQKLANVDEGDFKISRNNNNNRVPRIRKPMKQNSNSVPVNIPDKPLWFKYVEKKSNFFGDDFNDDGDEEEDEMVPPHVIISRRIAGKMMAFSVCFGYGRTLKGRDLSEVRNSVLRMTGFLEA